MHDYTNTAVASSMLCDVRLLYPVAAPNQPTDMAGLSVDRRPLASILDPDYIHSSRLTATSRATTPLCLSYSAPRSHGRCIRPHPRGELPSRSNEPADWWREHAPGDGKQLQCRDPGCVQGDIEQPMGRAHRRLLWYGEEAGMMAPLVAQRTPGSHTDRT